MVFNLNTSRNSRSTGTRDRRREYEPAGAEEEVRSPKDRRPSVQQESESEEDSSEKGKEKARPRRRSSVVLDDEISEIRNTKKLRRRAEENEGRRPRGKSQEQIGRQFLRNSILFYSFVDGETLLENEVSPSNRRRARVRSVGNFEELENDTEPDEPQALNNPRDEVRTFLF